MAREIWGTREGRTVVLGLISEDNMLQHGG